MNKDKLVLAVSAAALGVGTVVAVPAPAAAADGRDTLLVVMNDECDAATFNAAFGPGTCVGPGTTTVPQFLNQLQNNGRVRGWSFRPRAGRVDAHGQVPAVNTGGEPHTFTRVQHFGGGCIDQLNAILGLTPVPECSQTVVRGGKRVAKFEATLVPAGSFRIAHVGAAGVYRYECLIHPWMRTTVHVTGHSATAVAG